MTVGIRELKNNLSRYLERVKAGDLLKITDRGQVVALVIPAAASGEISSLMKLVREDRASWAGGKPEGAAVPEKATGKDVSKIVIEDRR